MSTTNVDIIQVDTQPSIKSIKDLRARIKELKDQLVQLDEGTDEYNKTARECGEAIHQLQVITETTRGFTSDFGDVLGNISTTAAGLVGGINAISSAIKIFGGESELAQEAMLKLQQSMAIVQGLSAIDAGIKSFKKLIPIIKAATTAMRSFAAANPFTAILVAATALVGVITAVIRSMDDGARQAERFAGSVSESLKQIDGMKKLHTWQLEYAEACGATTEEIEAMTRAQLENNRAQAEALTIAAQRKMEESIGNKKEFEQYQKAYQEAMDKWREISDEQLQFELNTLTADVKRRREAIKQSIADAKKAAAERIKIADDEYNHKKTLLDQEYEYQSSQLDPKDLKANYKLTKKYYEDLEALQIAYRDRVAARKKTADYDPVKDLDAANSAIISTQKNLNKLIADWQKVQEEARKATLQESANAQISETNIINQRELTELQHKHNLALREGTLTEAQLLAMDKERLQLQLEQFNGRYEELQMKLDSELISQIEYNEALANLQNEQLLLEDEIAQKSIDIEKAKVAAKLEEQKKLIEGYTQVADSVGDALGSIASMMDEESEGYRALMITQTIISMLSGSVKAWTAAMDLGMPMGAIVGAAQSAAIIANGVATIAKMKTASGNTSVSSSATSIASATPTTQTYMSGSYQQTETKPDTRVYVLESDISNVQRNVRTGVRESTF